MSDQYIVEHCSPTLAGIKTGNLFSVKTGKKRNISREIRELNKVLTKKGLRAIPVRKTETYTLIYLYRPDYLARDLMDPECLKILKKRGYPCGKPQSCLIQLCKRFLEADVSFPHEIGLFLGYPPVDVQGFIDDKNACVNEVGYWKVYGDVQKAKQTFHRYKTCTQNYIRQIRAGKSLAQLIVSKSVANSVAAEA